MRLEYGKAWRAPGLHRGRLPSAALLAAAALLLGACAGGSETALDSGLAPAPQAPAAAPGGEAHAALPGQAAAHAADPGNPAAALAYARGLRAADAKAEALAVLDKAAAARPGERRLTLERGLLALEIGDTGKAEKLLRQAHDAKAPDWRLHSALGAALASGGRQKEAQAEFAKALALAPEHPSVLNNLALSYALDGKAETAEKLLRQARGPGSKAPQVQGNLALVAGLRSKHEGGEGAVPPVAKAPPAGNAAQAQAAKPAMPAKPTAAVAASKPEGAPDAWTTATRAAAKPAAGEAREVPKANASLPQPVYQLGGADLMGR